VRLDPDPKNKQSANHGSLGETLRAWQARYAHPAYRKGEAGRVFALDAFEGAIVGIFRGTPCKGGFVVIDPKADYPVIIDLLTRRKLRGVSFRLVLKLISGAAGCPLSQIKPGWFWHGKIGG